MKREMAAINTSQ